MNIESDLLATPADAVREYAYNAGMYERDRAWVLTPQDVWMPNPFYRGEPIPHPETHQDDN